MSGFRCYYVLEIGGEDASGLADRLLRACLEKGPGVKISGGVVVTLCPLLIIPPHECDAYF